MDANELLRKVRQIEIKTRGLSQNILRENIIPLLRDEGSLFQKSANINMAMRFGILIGT